MPRRVPASRIKSHRSYEIGECADLLGVTDQTVREWIKRGLPALTEKRPFLILGWQAKAWLADRQIRRTRPLRQGEFYCLRCKAPREAAFGLVEQSHTQEHVPVLTGFCAVCETLCRRFVPRG